MPSQDAAACLCGNTRPVTVECESVCRGCGVVLGVERHPEGPGAGRLSLFLRLENGGRAAALPGRTKKLHIHTAATWAQSLMSASSCQYAAQRQ